MIKKINVPEYKPGIYVLMLGGEPVYIGQTKHVTMRLCQHKQTGKKFDDVFLIECEPTIHDALEGELIRKFLPKGNINVLGRPHAPAKVKGFDASYYIRLLKKALDEQSQNKSAA